MKKILFISSTGGHLAELMALDELIDSNDSLIVTEKDQTTINLSNKYLVEYLVKGSRTKKIRYIFKFGYNTLKSLAIFIKFKPEVIITTGAHSAVPMCYIGKLFNKQIIFIESMARVNSKSLSGKLIEKVASEVIVQHEEMLDVYENAKLGGTLL